MKIRWQHSENVGPVGHNAHWPRRRKKQDAFSAVAQDIKESIRTEDELTRVLLEIARFCL